MSTGSGSFEIYQHSTISSAEETRQRLSERAFKLLEAGMMPSTPTHKHKWATGREKWEAVQRDGERAAGKRGRGRPRKEVNWEERLREFTTDLSRYHRCVLKEIDLGLPLEVMAARLTGQLAELESAGVLTEEVAMATRLMLG